MNEETPVTEPRVFDLPYGITATLHPDGAFATTQGEWVITDSQAKGLQVVLLVIAKALEFGVEPNALNASVAQVIRSLQVGGLR